MHRDIKPENIVFATKEGGTNNRLEDRAQIADFTCALRIPRDNPNFLIGGEEGTIVFMAPESVNASYLPKPIDVWALGVTIYACVYKRLPFFILNREEYFKKV